jgi:Flp pilus assembly protein TadG
MRRPARGRATQYGQAIIEVAIATPVLIGLLLGAFNVAVLISDKVVAGYAVRQGARLAAEEGGTDTNPLPATTASIDQDIVKNVLAVAQAMNYTTLLDIYIYRVDFATMPDGALSDPPAAGVHFNRYNGVTGAQVGALGFPISERSQIPPNETSIGVKLIWTFTPPTGTFSFTIRLSEYAVMRASPVLLT